MLQTERKQLEQHDWAEEATGGGLENITERHAFIDRVLMHSYIRNITERQFIHLNPRS